MEATDERVHAEIEIAAPPGLVWEVLADFSRFPEWNPFIRKAEGNLQEGARVKMSIAPPGGIRMTLTPLLTKVSEHRGFRWLGHLILPGLFDGEHQFNIVPTGKGKVLFIQHETFRGILVPLLWTWFKGPTKRGFEEMNGALKKRVEMLAGRKMNP